jgi:hypothetical protein
MAAVAPRKVPSKITWTGLWAGDGREKVQPPKTQIGRPVQVRRSQGRMMIESFCRTGSSFHSGSAATLWVLIDYCESNGVSYTLEATPGMGYNLVWRSTEH